MSASAFSFIQITDHHVCDSDSTYIHGFSTNYALRVVLSHIAQNMAGAVDFIISTGDLVDRSTPQGYQFFRNMLGLKGSSLVSNPQFITACGLQDFPIYFLPGNHDDRQLFFYSIYPDTAPTLLMNTSFLHKGIQFVLLDWGSDVKGVMHIETLSFLQKALASERPSILLMHHPVAPIGCRWLDEFLADDLESFWNIVMDKPVLGIFAGHVHATFETKRRGIPFYTVGSTGFQFALQEQPLICLTPPQYRIIRVQDGFITTQVVDVPLER